MVRLLIALFLCCQSAQDVKPGAEVLAESGFELLRERRVGLVVNHTARVGERHLLGLVHEAPGIEVGAIFGPEHGLRGTEEAGDEVSDGIDRETGAPVYSLYGRVNRPTPEMLEGIDVLVFDIQDIGARFYTYISTMGLAMQSAAEAGVPFVVLDRPNPLGGEYVSGFVLEPEHASFVGRYPIPVVHGMTAGELALMIRGEAMLAGLQDLELTVVQAEGWLRHMQWPDTGLPWVATSPNIPTFETALVYPGTCFFEATAASEGRGTNSPFLLVGAPWADSVHLAEELNGRALPGVRFEAATFTPRPVPGMDTSPKLSNRQLGGIRLDITDLRAFMPLETGMYVLSAFYRMGGEDLISRPSWLARLAGTERLAEMLSAGENPDTIIRAWEHEVDSFRRLRAPYLLY